MYCKSNSHSTKTKKGVDNIACKDVDEEIDKLIAQ